MTHSYPSPPPFIAPAFALGQRVNTLLGVAGLVFGRTEPTFTESGEEEFWVRLDDGREFHTCRAEILDAIPA